MVYSFKERASHMIQFPKADALLRRLLGHHLLEETVFFNDALYEVHCLHGAVLTKDPAAAVRPLQEHLKGQRILAADAHKVVSFYRQALNMWQFLEGVVGEAKLVRLIEEQARLTEV